MQKLIQQLLKLTPTSDAKHWLELEKLILASSSKMTKQELLDVCGHYGEHEKGTFDFWNSMSEVALIHYKKLYPAEFCNLFKAFAHAGTQYDFSEKFESQMVEGLENVTTDFGNIMNKIDPTMGPSIGNKLNELEEEFKKMEDPFLEFMDDLKDEKLGPKEKEEAIKIRAFAKEFTEKWKRFL